MGLKDIQIPTEEVTIRGQAITLRGLGFSDVAYLIHIHSETLNTFVAKAQTELEAEGGESAADVGSLLSDALATAPELAADVIALAADEPDAADTVRKLAAPTQLDMLMKIGRLTFEEAGGVKKFAENVIVLMTGARKTLSDFNSTGSSPESQSESTGSSDSAGK